MNSDDIKKKEKENARGFVNAVKSSCELHKLLKTGAPLQVLLPSPQQAFYKKNSGGKIIDWTCSNQEMVLQR